MFAANIYAQTYLWGHLLRVDPRNEIISAETGTPVWLLDYL